MKKLFLVLAIIVLTMAMFSGCSYSLDEEKQDDTTSKKTQPTSDTKSEKTKEPELTDIQVEANLIIEPTQIISLDEASTLIGEEARKGEKTEQAVTGLKALIYEAVDESSFEFIQISITQQSFMPNNGQSPQTIYDSIVAAFDGGEKVDGIGDTAVFATPGIHIMSDGYYISIGAGNLNDEAVREKLKQAGAQAVKNLREIVK